MELKDLTLNEEDMTKDTRRHHTAPKTHPKALNFVDHLKEILASKDRTKKVIGTILFAVPIMIVFVFFGLPKNDLSGGASAAQVNKIFISLKEFSQEESRIQKMQEYYAQMFGQPFTFDPERHKMIRRQAIESLIQNELLSQGAEEEGVLVSDKEILEKIKEIPEFKKEGFFQASHYFQLLEANNLTPSQFEKSIKKQVQALRTKEIFEISIKPSLYELNLIKELKSTQWNVQFVKLDKEELSKKMAVTASEVQKNLSQEEFVKRATAYFEANKNQYDTPEKISAQVIVINFKPGDAASMKGAEDKTKLISEKVKTEDFGKLAQTYSEDLGSKNRKGDLGFFARGEKDPSMEQVAFSLPVGEVSSPIKGFSSYQIIKVNGKVPLVKAVFDNVKTKIASELISRDIFDTQLKQIEEALKKNDLNVLSQAMNVLNTHWDETGFFNLDTTQIPKLSEKELKSAVFQLSPSKKLSSSITYLKGAKYIVYLKETKVEASTLDLKKEVMNLAQQKGSQLQDDWIQSLRKVGKININPIIYQ